MLSSDVQEIQQSARHLIGFSIRASLNEIIANKLGNQLRETLAARDAEIAGQLDAGVYLVQVYEPGPWSPDTPFTQVMGKAVADTADVPDGMTAHTIPAGAYLRFLHRGPMNEIGATYDAMREWLVRENRAGPCPYDFEYWQDAERLEEPDTEIAIHLPVARR